MLRASLLVSTLVVAAASGAILTPSPAAADPPRAQIVAPAPLKPAPKRPSRVLVVGLTTLLSGYVPFAFLGAEALASGAPQRRYQGWGIVPLAGPWLVIGERGNATSDAGGAGARLYLDIFAGLMGLSQGVGAIALGAYAAPPEPDSETERTSAGIQITPVFGLGTAGVVGTF